MTDKEILDFVQAKKVQIKTFARFIGQPPVYHAAYIDRIGVLHEGTNECVREAVKSCAGNKGTERESAEVEKLRAKISHADEILAELEDTIKGYEGDLITRLRKSLQRI